MSFGTLGLGQASGFDPFDMVNKFAVFDSGDAVSVADGDASALLDEDAVNDVVGVGVTHKVEADCLGVR